MNAKRKSVTQCVCHFLKVSLIWSTLPTRRHATPAVPMRARKWAGTVSSLERRAAGPATKWLHPELQACHAPAMPAAFLGRALPLSAHKRSLWPGFPVERPFLWRGFRVHGPARREDRDKDKDEDEKPAKRLPSDDPSQVPLGVLADV